MTSTPIARYCTAVLCFITICWTSLYIHQDRWEVINDSVSLEGDKLAQLDQRVERSSALTSGSYNRTVSAADLQKLREFGKSNRYRKFKPMFTKEEKAQVMEALAVLTNVLESANISYFLYGGSLIGSWRHHDIVPWDDDLDIIVNISDWRSLEGLAFGEGYVLNTHTLNRYKFYSSRAKPIPGYFWSWPYIDICFFGDNGTHLFDMDPTFSKSFLYKKTEVYPLERRPFGGLSLYAPKNTAAVIAQNYRLDECQTRSYDHRHQKSIPSANITTVSCSLLYRIHPFVFRDDDHHPTAERLYLDNQLLHIHTNRPASSYHL